MTDKYVLSTMGVSKESISKFFCMRNRSANFFVWLTVVLWGVELKKKCGERTQKTSHLQQHFNLSFKSVFNEVFTFIALQTKNMKKVCESVPTHKKTVWERRSHTSRPITSLVVLRGHEH